ncbi:MAG TPA: MobA/MobL family protein [Bryobacteraceae bacterium]|nr:MobA/MobL family protein [Bryobacteraceae bacterium]
MRVLELHAPMQVVQRSQGRTATAAAAYRSGTKIICERTGIVHDYTRKQGVEETALLLPDNAPDWAHDRAKLWNSCEKVEKHPRAQTAREIQIAFPAEFSPAQRKKAGLQIAQWVVTRYGVAADLAWHQPSIKGDQRNFHLHLLFTTRRFKDGEWAATKDRTLDDLKKGPTEVAAMRTAVAGVLNDIAVREELGIYIEHLSFEARGLDREPTQHLGPDASEMERRGVATDIGNHNRAVALRNQQREKLHQERAVLATQTNKPGQIEQITPSLISTDSQSVARTTLYADIAKRRRAMLEEQDRRYGQHEKELRKRIAGLNASIDHNNPLVRSWRRAIGRTRQEKTEVRGLTGSYDRILEERRSAHVQFEKERRAQIENMKTSFRKVETISSSDERTHLAKPFYSPRLLSEEVKAAKKLFWPPTAVQAPHFEKREGFTKKQEPALAEEKPESHSEQSKPERRQVEDVEYDDGQDYDRG